VKALLIDAGNTAVKAVVCEGRAMSRAFCVPTRLALSSPEELIEKVKEQKCQVIGVSSVVEKVTRVLKDHFPKIFVVSAKVKLPLKLNYDAKALGADRIANACGALEFGDSAVVVSAGTATVVDVVKEKVFEGGVILPGIGTMLKCLHRETSALPPVEFEGSVSVPGRTTAECVRAGALLASICTIKEMNRLSLPVLVTGGWGRVISQHTGYRYVPELTFIGMLKIMKENGLWTT
jgi:type III pantothenate kinase